MDLYVEPGHADAGDPRLVWFARALAAMDGEVVIAEGDENLVRARRAGDPGRRPFVVVAAGLPNLVHEFAHAIQFGGLADDHGFDYSRIPLDVRAAADRTILWDELACAVISCAYAAPERVDAWFKEQVEIQGVFYGCADAEFGGVVEAAVAAHPGEAEARLAWAYGLVEAALRAAGAPPELARPVQRLELAALWRRYRDGRGGARWAQIGGAIPAEGAGAAPGCRSVAGR